MRVLPFFLSGEGEGEWRRRQQRIAQMFARGKVSDGFKGRHRERVEEKEAEEEEEPHLAMHSFGDSRAKQKGWRLLIAFRAPPSPIIASQTTKGAPD